MATKTIQTFSPATMRWVLNQCRRVDAFTMNGDVHFEKTETNMSAFIRPGGRGGGAGSLQTLGVPCRIDAVQPVRTLEVNIASQGLKDVDVQWKYAVTQIAINGFGYVPVTGGLVVTFDSGSEPLVVNLREMGHTDIFAWGVDMTLADYPIGYRPRPVGGGGAGLVAGGNQSTLQTDEPVMVHKRINADGDPVYVMSEMGSHDGLC